LIQRAVIDLGLPHGGRCASTLRQDNRIVADTADNHVARQHCTDQRLSLQRAVREPRIAGPENPVRLHIHVELGLKRRGDVDFGEDAEPSFGERSLGSGDSVVETRLESL
jgi:hypothetical protein